MAKVLSNKDGVPLIAYGRSYILDTTGASVTNKPGTRSLTYTDEKITLGNMEISPWGDENDFPQKADETIRKTGVLNSGLKFIRNFTVGQGIFPVEVTGFDSAGNEELKVIDDKDLRKFCISRIVRRYIEKASRDYLKFGPAFVELVPNEEGNKIVGINVINALHCRYTVAKKGIIEKCVVSGRWPDQPTERSEYSVIDVLDEYDPYADLERRRLDRSLKGKTVIFPVKDSWSNKDYYSEPIWHAAKLAGWVDIANKVPQFLLKAYENQISWKWHVQIPYAFWDRKFPASQYKDEKLRKEAIDKFLDDLEKNLTDSQNANKAIFSFFELNSSGKAEEEWKITALDNKYKEGDKLITSAAANSEILFALMLNPNVMGAGMPGGTYAGNQGGSNIREAFLVNIANAWLDRQNLLDPIECVLKFNGKQDVELRFRNTILTTLDSGSGTTQNLS